MEYMNRQDALRRIFPLQGNTRTARRAQERATGKEWLSRSRELASRREILKHEDEVPDEEPPALDPRPYPERRDAAIEALTEQFARPYPISLDDTRKQRVAVAWRLVRELARQVQNVESTNPLSETLEPDHQSPDPWIYPRPLYVPQTGPAYPEIQDVALAAEKVKHPPVDNKGRNYPGLPLLPPDAPPGASEDLNYDPARDELLVLYTKALTAVANWLGVRETLEGRLGMLGLEEPYYVRLAFPSRWQILAYEEAIVDKALAKVVDSGQARARKEFVKGWGFSPREAGYLVALSRKEGLERMSGDVEEDRALVAMRLEELAARARDNLNVRDEIMATKQLSIVLGLGKVEPDDHTSEFIKVVRALDREENERELLVHAPMKEITVQNNGE